MPEWVDWMLLALEAVGVVAVVVMLARVASSPEPVLRAPGPEWRQAAKSLSWKTRWALFVANTRGLAATPRFAALAARRAESRIAGIDCRRASPKARRARLAIGVGFLSLCVVKSVTADFDWVAVAWGVVGLSYLAQPLINRWERGRLLGSLERNRALLDEPTTAAASA